MKKTLFIILDGAAGNPELGETAYMISNKRNLDELAQKSQCGMMYPINDKIAPESDMAVLSLLGIDPEKHYPGRGALEALGAGLSLSPGKEIALRGNFSTIDPQSKRIIDRRAGRHISDREGKELANSVNNMSLDDGKGYARVIHTISHRVVVIIGHKEKSLSPMISNTDPAYVRFGMLSHSAEKPLDTIQRAIPLEKTEEAELTAKLINEFTDKAIDALSKHSINEERIKRGLPPANAILVRDAGVVPSNFPKFKDLYPYNINPAAIVEMPVERGIALLLGINLVEIKNYTDSLEERYQLLAQNTHKLLDNYDFVYVHLKGPDEPGHDGDCRRKASIIEKIDRFYIEPLLKDIFSRHGNNISIIITSDHATPCKVGAHTSDPVPILFYNSENVPDGTSKFDEIECKNKGNLGTFDRGYKVLPYLLKMIYG